LNCHPEDTNDRSRTCKDQPTCKASLKESTLAYALVLNSFDALLTNLASDAVKLPQTVHTEMAKATVKELVPNVCFHFTQLYLGGVGIKGLLGVIAKG